MIWIDVLVVAIIIMLLLRWSNKLIEKDPIWNAIWKDVMKDR